MVYHKILSSLTFTLALAPVILYGQSNRAPSYGTNDTQVANEESPYEGGVFDRGEVEIPSPQEEESVDRADVLIDENRDTNQIIVQLDLGDSEITQDITGNLEFYSSLADAEAAVLYAVNSSASDAIEYFNGASQAWYMIHGERLSEEARQALNTDDPLEILQQYIVLSYPSIEDAKTAVAQLLVKSGVLYASIDRALEFSWSPNDPYFPIDSQSAGYYQWGIHAMRFPQAWNVTRGHGHVGVIDSGLPNSQAPSDLQQNFRSQFSTDLHAPPSSWPWSYHGTHVMGIIAAEANNNMGISGACPTCSATMARVYVSNEVSLAVLASDVSSALKRLIARGMQVINMSFNLSGGCSSVFAPICTAIDFADDRDVLIVASAGNSWNAFRQFPAAHPSVLAVGGAENTDPANPNSNNWSRWHYNNTWGSSKVSSGIMAPARAIVSTVPAGETYAPQPQFNCADVQPIDESGISYDGYGSCTGTSMAAPYISGLAGILRSINPRLTRQAVQDIIRTTGTDGANPGSWTGYGLGQADLAVNSAVSQTPNRLTPLFSQFSWNRRDFLFTTVPQMASAATHGTLRPAKDIYIGTNYRYYSAGGYAINGYNSYPDAYSEPSVDYTPKAAAWIFTTPQNPKSTATPLVPLYRLSWKCDDSLPNPAICSSAPGHIDTTYTTEVAGITAFESVGYKLDGIEGYIYPKALPQPPGTVKLLRKYNSQRDDHAIFPETVQSYFASLGYTVNSGSDWLGYVYPNTTGNVPAIQ